MLQESENFFQIIFKITKFEDQDYKLPSFAFSLCYG